MAFFICHDLTIHVSTQWSIRFGICHFTRPYSSLGTFVTTKVAIVRLDIFEECSCRGVANKGGDNNFKMSTILAKTLFILQ